MGSRRPLGLSAFYSLNDTQWRRDDELREWPSDCPANDADDLGGCTTSQQGHICLPYSSEAITVSGLDLRLRIHAAHRVG